MTKFPVPEIQRSNLESILLQLKAINIEKPWEFGFMDKPPVETMLIAMNRLYQLQALDENGNLTELGRQVSISRQLCILSTPITLSPLPHSPFPHSFGWPAGLHPTHP